MRQTVLVNALQQSGPHDPVHLDGGTNDLTREAVSLFEERMHFVAFALKTNTFEQKKTKETKKYCSD